MKMRRTQLYLDDETHRLAAWQAKMMGTTISEVLRQSIKAQIKSRPKRDPGEFILWIKELHKKYPTPKGAPTDLALEHDHYLYGTPKKYAKNK